MKECYICSRDVITRCKMCNRDICKAHAEDEIIINGEISAICTSCKKKKQLNRIRLYTIIAFIIMAAAIVLGLVLTSRTLW